MIKSSFILVFLLTLSNVLAVQTSLERTLVLNNVGIAYDVHTLNLDRARTDVSIVQDNLLFRCGGLASTASAAPTYPQFRRCSLLSGNPENDVSLYYSLIPLLPTTNETLIVQDSLVAGFKYRKATDTTFNVYDTRFGHVDIQQRHFEYDFRTLHRHRFVVSQPLEYNVFFYPDDDMSRGEQSLSQDI